MKIKSKRSGRIYKILEEKKERFGSSLLGKTISARLARLFGWTMGNSRRFENGKVLFLLC